MHGAKDISCIILPDYQNSFEIRYCYNPYFIDLIL